VILRRPSRLLDLETVVVRVGSTSGSAVGCESGTGGTGSIASAGCERGTGGTGSITSSGEEGTGETVSIASANASSTVPVSSISLSSVRLSLESSLRRLSRPLRWSERFERGEGLSERPRYRRSRFLGSGAAPGKMVYREFPSKSLPCLLLERLRIFERLRISERCGSVVGLAERLLVATL
jgi:hypothetical protein